MAKVKVTWQDLKMDGPQSVRDLWQHKNLGSKPDGFEADVAPHDIRAVESG